MWCDFSPGNAIDSVGKLCGERVGKGVTKLTEEFEKEVDVAVNSLYTPMIEEVTAFLSGSDKEMGNGEIRTAVVQCGISETSRIRTEVIRKMQGKCKDFTVISINENSEVNDIIADVTNEGNGIFFVELCESLSPDFMNKLIRLLVFYGIRIPLLVCVSTDASSFVALCSLDALNMLEANCFSTPSPNTVFDAVCESVLRWMEKDENPLALSGDLLSSLRRTFFISDHSVQNFKSSVKFAVINHIIDHPECLTKDPQKFRSACYRYWTFFNLFCDEAVIDKRNSGLRSTLHEHILIHGDLRDSNEYRQWRSSMLSSNQACLLNFSTKFCNQIKDAGIDYSGVDNAFTEYMKAESEGQGKENKRKEELVISKKTTMTEFKQQLEEHRKQKLNNPILAKKEALIVEMENIWKSVLTDWTKFPDASFFVVSNHSLHQLHMNPANNIEESLLNDKYSYQPLSVAYRTLQDRSTWKSASLVEWGNNFEEKLDPKLVPQAPAAFFASLGQLELTGIVKANGTTAKSRVAVLHHPSSQVV